MKEESNNTKKLSLDKKQIVLLVFLVFLILIFSVFLYVRKNRNSDIKQDQGEEKIVSELEDEEDLGESLEEENVEEDIEESTPESSKTTTPSIPSEDSSSSTPSSESKTPVFEALPPPKIVPPRQQVESLWTPDATSVIIDSKETITINGTKYLTVTVRRGTLKVGDTLKQTGICGIVPDVPTKVKRMIRAGKLVNSATVSESVGISMDNDYFYKRATFGTDMQLATKVKLKVYVFTKEEGNTKETSVVNDQGYLLSFVPEDPSGRTFITGNGTPVISKPIKPGEAAEIEVKKFIMLGGPALYEPGTRIKVKDQNTNERIGIAVITGYPPCPHK